MIIESSHTNMNKSEIAFFTETIKGVDRYVEYGSGVSTEIARNHCKQVTSIETDPEWARKTGAYHCNIGKVVAWGYPLKPPQVYMLRQYFSFAKDFDILFIDGRYRASVALHATPGLILIHDYERKQYHVVEKYMKKIKQVDRLALFEKKEEPIITLELLTKAL